MLAASPTDMMKSFPLNPHHEIGEILVDNIGSLFFDSQTLRLELTVARVNEIRPETKPTGGEARCCEAGTHTTMHDGLD